MNFLKSDKTGIYPVSCHCQRPRWASGLSVRRARSAGAASANGQQASRARVCRVFLGMGCPFWQEDVDDCAITTPGRLSAGSSPFALPSASGAACLKLSVNGYIGSRVFRTSSNPAAYSASSAKMTALPKRA